MALLGDIIYHLETTENIDHLDLTDRDCIKTAKYLIMNLQDHHQIPGDIYYQFIGILDWYQEHNFITDKQWYWLMVNLWRYIDQRDMVGEVI